MPVPSRRTSTFQLRRHDAVVRSAQRWLSIAMLVPTLVALGCSAGKTPVETTTTTTQSALVASNLQVKVTAVVQGGEPGGTTEVLARFNTFAAPNNAAQPLSLGNCTGGNQSSCPSIVVPTQAWTKTITVNPASPVFSIAGEFYVRPSAQVPPGGVIFPRCFHIAVNPLTGAVSPGAPDYSTCDHTGPDETSTVVTCVGDSCTAALSVANVPNDLSPYRLTVQVKALTTCTPTPEVLDGVDNDCDSLIDECDAPQAFWDCTISSYPVAACVGRPGHATCNATGAQACLPVAPGNGAADMCGDGLDNDCDGQVDEGTPEALDGVDNDCDGKVDECDAPQTFWNCTVTSYPLPVCVGGPGHAVCNANGAQVCLPFGPSNGNPDVCDGKDFDCDGQVDEDFVPKPSGATCGTGACTRPEIYTSCVSGQQIPSCTPGAPTAEVAGDSIDNDCDGLVDECAAGSTDWRCCTNTGRATLEFNVVPNVPMSSDPVTTPACVPLSVNPAATCSLRGVFQVAHDTADNSCDVVAHVATGNYALSRELRLDRGNLRLIGNDNEPSLARVTTTVSCATEDCFPCRGTNCGCLGLECSCSGPDCFVACPIGVCGHHSCGEIATHRLVNAIFATDRPQVLRAHNALEISGMSFDGGQMLDQANFGPSTAGGGLVVDGGSFIGTNVVIADNRARGHGAGLAVYNAPLLRLTDAVVRDNANTQDLVAATASTACHDDVGGGMTGFSGGVHSSSVTSTEITSSAFMRNVAADGGGMGVFGGTLTMINSTVASNMAAASAGGVLLVNVSAVLRFNTITGNRSGFYSAVVDTGRVGAGIDAKGTGTLAAFGNVLAANINPFSSLGSSIYSDDCRIDSDVTVTGAAFNLIGSGGRDCVKLGAAAAGTLIGTGNGGGSLSAGLGALPPADVGSRSQVVPLLATSPAINVYPLSNALPANTPVCPAWDQRSFLRPPAGRCDLGAYEVEGVDDPDHDGIAGQIDPQATLFSNAFSDTAQFGNTTGTIVTRGNQTLVLTDATGLQNGIIAYAFAGGGTMPAQISACGGTLQVTLQAGQSRTITCPDPHSCLYSAQTLTVKDRSDLMTDFFGGGFTFGIDMQAMANGLSVGNGFLNTRATILKNATLTGVLTGERTGVKGLLLEHASVPNQSFIVRPGTSTGTDLTVPLSGSATLQPGAKGNVLVRGGGTLTLAGSGLYRFKSLQFEGDTRLSLTGDQNLTAVAVDGSLILGDRFRMDSGGGPRLQQAQTAFYSNGTATVGFDAFVTGSLEAPAGLVTLQDRSYFSGCVAGKTVTVGFDATVGNNAPIRICDGSNRVGNPGFETNTTGWSATSGATLSTTTSRFHSGTKSGSVTGRTAATQGAVYDLLSSAPQGATYDVSAWAQPSTSTSQPLTVSARIRCNGGQDQTVALGQTTGKNTAWTRLTGVLTVPNCPLGALSVTVAGPPSGVGVFVDDLSLVQRCP